MKTIKTSILILVLLILSFLVLTSCNKEVDIKPETDFAGTIFIESILFPGEIPKVFVSRALPFFNPDVLPQEIFARGATVQIDGPLGTEILTADSIFDKFRCRWVPFYQGQFPAQYGASYDLTVMFDGETYNASTSIIQTAAQIDTLEFVGEFFDIYGGHDGVVIYFRDVPNEVNYYRYQMDRMIDRNRNHVDVLEGIGDCVEEGEFFSISDYGRTVFTDEGVDGQNLTLFIEVAFEYVKGDSTWVMLQSLDPNAAAFYAQLDEQLLARVNPFVEPVFLDTQIPGAIGVFGSAVKSDSVLFIYPVSAD